MNELADQFDAHFTGKGLDRAHHDLGVRVAVDIPDQGGIQFEVIDLEAKNVLEVGVAGTEVVDGDAPAAGLDPLDEGRDLGKVLDPL